MGPTPSTLLENEAATRRSDRARIPTAKAKDLVASGRRSNRASSHAKQEVVDVPTSTKGARKARLSRKAMETVEDGVTETAEDGVSRLSGKSVDDRIGSDVEANTTVNSRARSAEKTSTSTAPLVDAPGQLETSPGESQVTCGTRRENDSTSGTTAVMSRRSRKPAAASRVKRKDLIVADDQQSSAGAQLHQPEEERDQGIPTGHSFFAYFWNVCHRKRLIKLNYCWPCSGFLLFKNTLIANLHCLYVV